MSVDAHAHLTRCEAPHELLREAAAAGLDGMVIPGVWPAEAAPQRALCAEVPGLCWTLGLHPEQCDETGVASARRAFASALAHFQPAGIGEVGLDRRFPTTMPAQRAALEIGLTAAQEHRLPLVLHVVGAHAEVLDRLQGARWRGMVHGFGGSAAEAERYLALGLHLSIGCAVTLGASRRRSAVLEVIPIDRLLLETDAPDQAPQPWRATGVRGRPAMLRAVCTAAAALRGADPDALWMQAGANARALFEIPGALPRDGRSAAGAAPR